MSKKITPEQAAQVDAEIKEAKRAAGLRMSRESNILSDRKHLSDAQVAELEYLLSRAALGEKLYQRRREQFHRILIQIEKLDPGLTVEELLKRLDDRDRNVWLTLHCAFLKELGG